MFERLANDGRVFEAVTRDHIKHYAEAGLRTLVVAYRELGEEEFQSWQNEFLDAQASLSTDRDVLVDAASDKIERDLLLLGATAVEDKLQKGVNIRLAFSNCSVIFYHVNILLASHLPCSNSCLNN